MGLDLDEMYRRLIKDGAQVHKKVPQPDHLLMFDSPESEEAFKKLVLGDQQASSNTTRETPRP